LDYGQEDDNFSREWGRYFGLLVSMDRCSRIPSEIILFKSTAGPGDDCWSFRQTPCDDVEPQLQMDVNCADYRYESRTGPLSCLASTSSWFVIRNHQKREICDSGIHLKCKIPILGFYLTSSQNVTTKQTNEGLLLVKVLLRV
jgi:hypothetical protein